MEKYSGLMKTLLRSAIHAAGHLKLRTDIIDKTLEEGCDIAPEHVLAVFNSFRLLCSVIGFDRKEKPPGSLQDYIAAKTRESTGGTA